MSTNAPQQRAPRSKRSRVVESPTKYRPTSMQDPPSVYLQNGPKLNPLVAGVASRRFVPSAEEDEEFRLTVGGMGKKRGFNVFRVPEVSPGRTESPLEDHRFDSGAPASLQDPFTDRTGRRLDYQHNQSTHMYPGPSTRSGRVYASPTPAARGFGFHASSKENSQTENGHTRRTLSESNVFPAQFFYDAVDNPLYNHSYNRSMSYSSQSYSDYKPPSGYASHFNEEFRPVQNMSSSQPNDQMIGFGSGGVASTEMHYDM